MRYFIKLAYDGAGFHGWQSQPNACSVQQTIEEALSTVLRVETKITGAGRTDTGVNARCMYAHFDVEKPICDEKKFLVSLNRMVGHRIALQALIPVGTSAHARFDAVERTYRYFILFEKSPFLEASSWCSPTRLGIDKMNCAAELLLGRQDFTSFSKLHTDVKTNICDIRRAEWKTYDNIYGVPGIYFEISADRFLRNMVRAIVGTLVDVGRGRITLEQFREIIGARDRCRAGTSMPPQALFLWNIKYPFLQKI